jgi:prevent-host-death family protein
MKKTVSATEARVHFGELLRAVAEEGTTYIVERGGKPQAVVISAEEYDELAGKREEEPYWWTLLEKSRATFQAEFKGKELPDPVELINAGRQERDDAILGDLLRREPDRSPDNSA